MGSFYLYIRMHKKHALVVLLVRRKNCYAFASPLSCFCIGESLDNDVTYDQTSCIALCFSCTNILFSLYFKLIRACSMFTLYTEKPFDWYWRAEQQPNAIEGEQSCGYGRPLESKLLACETAIDQESNSTRTRD